MTYFYQQYRPFLYFNFIFEKLFFIIVYTYSRNGDCRVLDPNTDSYVYVHSYLLVWMVVIKICEEATAEIRYRYGIWLK